MRCVTYKMWESHIIDSTWPIHQPRKWLSRKSALLLTSKLVQHCFAIENLASNNFCYLWYFVIDNLKAYPNKWYALWKKNHFVNCTEKINFWSHMNMFQRWMCVFIAPKSIYLVTLKALIVYTVIILLWIATTVSMLCPSKSCDF